jgi:biotin carboxyl carrier protein
MTITYTDDSTTTIEVGSGKYKSNIADKNVAMTTKYGDYVVGTKVSALEGKTYEMEIELVPEETAPQSAVRSVYQGYQNAAADPTVRLMDPSSQRTTTIVTGTVTAPMPGTVLKLCRKEGEMVHAGEVVLVLEAMKMENEILSPADGTILRMNCEEGKTVAGGEVLFEVN